MSADTTPVSELLAVQTFDAILAELAALGPPSEIRARAPGLAARLLDFDRVLLTSVAEGALAAEGVSVARAGEAPKLLERLRAEPASLAYPRVEGEVVRRRRAQVVRVSAGDPPGRCAFATVFAWEDYVIAPIQIDGQVVGLFHADHSSGRALGEHDAATLSTFAACFALVYERAALRHRLRVQREEMRRVARWAEARSSDLGGIGIDLVGEPSATASPGLQTPPGFAEHALRELLTQRELDVLRYIVRGETNAGIARALVVSEGTVKFHVKNILRKLGASNRAEATSRYLTMAPNDRDARSPS